MAILNRTSDGLPNVLVLLVRTLRQKGAMGRAQLEALVAPPSLQQISSTFDNGKMVHQTLTRWIQIGLFHDEDGYISMSKGYETGSTKGIAGLKALGSQLRQLILDPSNNEDLLIDKPGKAADFTRAVCWVLAQDPFHLTTGSYKDLINRMENDQFPDEPWAFRNDTRWAGFTDWAPLLGFGWNSHVPKNNTFIIDPTKAVEDALPEVFSGRSEMSQDDFFHELADQLPVIDNGAYRTKVEDILIENSWHPIKTHEVSPSLSLSLLRLQEANRLHLESRSDAPHRTLLGRGFANIRKVSHLRLLEVS